MARDWHEWHRSYDDPASSLSRRLLVVQGALRAELAARVGPLRIVSMCAGDGRDVLPVLAEHPQLPMRVRLVELDPVLTAAARACAKSLGLSRVEVVAGDAGATDAYADLAPIDVVLACGVFGNISRSDIDRTIGTLASLLARDGTVIWTRGRGDDGELDQAEHVRALFAAHGFAEQAFVAPDDARFRVGVHRARHVEATRPSERMFAFIR